MHSFWVTSLQRPACPLQRHGRDETQLFSTLQHTFRTQWRVRSSDVSGLFQVAIRLGLVGRIKVQHVQDYLDWREDMRRITYAMRWNDIFPDKCALAPAMFCTFPSLPPHAPHLSCAQQAYVSPKHIIPPFAVGCNYLNLQLCLPIKVRTWKAMHSWVKLMFYTMSTLAIALYCSSGCILKDHVRKEELYPRALLEDTAITTTLPSR